MAENEVLNAFVRDITLVVTNDYDSYNRLTAAVREATRGESDRYDFKVKAGEAVSESLYELIDEESSGTANMLLREFMGIGTHGWETVAESFYDEDDLPDETDEDD